MTLNTFHFAGHGAANVTLGIPRLREIVMTASQNIKTPTMQLPIMSTVSEPHLNKFCQSSTRLTLSQVVDEVTVNERLTSKSASTNYSRQKLYTVRLHMFPHDDVVAEHAITPEQILVGIQRTFVPLLDKAILKEIKQNDKEIKGQAGDVGKSRKVSAKAALEADAAIDGDDEALDAVAPPRDDGEEEDGDADDERRHKQGKDEKEYESEDGSSDNEEEGAGADLEATFKSDDESGNDSRSDSDDDSDDEGVQSMRSSKQSKKELLDKMRQIERRIASASRYVDKVSFDKEKGEWCEFELEVSRNLLVDGERN